MPSKTANKPTKGKIKANIPKIIYVKQFERDYLRPLFDRHGFNAHEQHFGAHVYVSLKRQRERREGDGIPVSYELRHKRLPKSRMTVLERVLEYTDHSIERHLSRAYRFKSLFAEEIEQKLMNVSTADYVDSRKVNYMTGDLVKPYTKGHIFRDANNNEEPEPLQNVWAAVREPVPVNLTNGERFIERRKVEMEAAGITHGTRSEEYEAAKNRYWNDRLCFLALCDQVIRRKGDIGWFVPNYASAQSGRLVMIGGGFQNASKGLKRTLITGVPGTDIRNWDFESCHPYLVIQALEEELEIEPKHLWDYIFNREKLAEQAGMSKKYFKQAVLALINGAKMPESPHRVPTISNSVLDIIIDDVGNDTRRVEQARQGLEEVTAGIRAEAAKMHVHLQSEWLPRNEQRRGRGGMRTVKNAVGKSLITNKASIGQLTAHYLQGVEQKLVNGVIVDLTEAGGKVLSHEYDGFVSLDQDPQPFLERAKKAAGVKYAVLSEKQFVEAAA